MHLCQAVRERVSGVRWFSAEYGAETARTSEVSGADPGFFERGGAHWDLVRF